MKTLVLAMALLVSTSSSVWAATKDRGGNVLEELKADAPAVPVKPVDVPTPIDSEDSSDTTPRCTADRAWCAWIDQGGAHKGVFLNLYDGRQRPEERQVWRHPLVDGDNFVGGPSFALWSHLVRLGAPALAVVASDAMPAPESAVLIPEFDTNRCKYLIRIGQPFGIATTAASIGSRWLVF